MNTTLLGTPLGDVASVSAISDENISILKQMGVRLQQLFSHYAILLLCHCFSIPKLIQVLSMFSIIQPHGLSCRHSPGSLHRHAAVNNIIHKALSSALHSFYPA